MSDDHFFIAAMVLILLLFLGLLFAGMSFWKLKEELDGIRKLDEVCPRKFNFNIDGVYFSKGDYYCVWTGGRSVDSIHETDVHERCHDLVHQEKDHFCGWIK